MLIGCVVSKNVLGLAQQVQRRVVQVHGCVLEAICKHLNKMLIGVAGMTERQVAVAEEVTQGVGVRAGDMVVWARGVWARGVWARGAWSSRVRVIRIRVTRIRVIRVRVIRIRVTRVSSGV